MTWVYLKRQVGIKHSYTFLMIRFIAGRFLRFSCKVLNPTKPSVLIGLIRRHFTSEWFKDEGAKPCSIPSNKQTPVMTDI